MLVPLGNDAGIASKGDASLVQRTAVEREHGPVLRGRQGGGHGGSGSLVQVRR